VLDDAAKHGVRSRLGLVRVGRAGHAAEGLNGIDREGTRGI
jgi:hypothetical protein